MVAGESENNDRFILPATDIILSSGSCPEIKLGSSLKDLRAEVLSESCNSGSPAARNLPRTGKDCSNNPGHTTASPVASNCVETPLSNGCSRNWLLSPDKNSESIERGKKLKRLRRVGDCPGARCMASNRDNSVLVEEVPKFGSKTSIIGDKLNRGG